MTPKEKAEELIIKYKQIIKAEWDTECGGYDLHGYELDAKLCALIAVDEILNETFLHDKTTFQHGRTSYWNQVKQEIEIL
jgi:hypothetical protein